MDRSRNPHDPGLAGREAPHPAGFSIQALLSPLATRRTAPHYSLQNKDRNDYRLSGTVRWNNQAALDCFAKGKVDWAYEHDLFYQKEFNR